jgi:hypothetical protein
VPILATPILKVLVIHRKKIEACVFKARLFSGGRRHRRGFPFLPWRFSHLGESLKLLVNLLCSSFSTRLVAQRTRNRTLRQWNRCAEYGFSAKLFASGPG